MSNDEPCDPINRRIPEDGEYRIVDDTVVERWSTWAGFWDVAYHAFGKADADRYVQEHTANETHTYIVAGERRQVGALGAPDAFRIEVEATSVEDAASQVTQESYDAGYEHVHIKAAVRPLAAQKRVEDLASAYWQARWEPGGTISDDKGNLTGTSDKAKALWDKTGTVIEDAARENVAALRRVGVPQKAALTVDHTDIDVTATQLRWRGHFPDGAKLDQLVSPPLRDIDKWCDGFRWTWTDDERLILTYCEGDISGQVFFTPEAFKEGFREHVRFWIKERATIENNTGYDLGDHVVLLGGFEDGITGEIVDIDLSSKVKPYPRFTIRTDQGGKEIGGIHAINMDIRPL